MDQARTSLRPVQNRLRIWFAADTQAFDKRNTGRASGTQFWPCYVRFNTQHL